MESTKVSHTWKLPRLITARSNREEYSSPHQQACLKTPASVSQRWH